MRGYDHSATAPPRQWAQRGIFILLALFALMAHTIAHSGKVSATGVSPVAIAVYGQGNYTSSSASTGTGGLSSPQAVALDSSGNL
ncbi:MAG TPA: hypothetical protein VGT82_02630, partial [Ktedonobacteraceae bacterium]|nr:hypothetical protein [Ktedonobacteraceae bacterium]